MEFVRKLYQYMDLHLESELIFELMDRDFFCYLEDGKSPKEIEEYLDLEQGGEALGEALKSLAYVNKKDDLYESSEKLEDVCLQKETLPLGGFSSIGMEA